MNKSIGNFKVFDFENPEVANRSKAADETKKNINQYKQRREAHLKDNTSITKMKHGAIYGNKLNLQD